MKTVNRKISELKPASYNPRKINSKQLDELKESIVKYGITEPIVINMKGTRKNVVISGHQRLKILQELGRKTAPCVELMLSKKDEMELNIRMNKNGGDFDYDILKEFFEKDLLMHVGFTMDELADLTNIDQAIDDIQENEPVYPIVPIMSEKYDYVVMFATNEIDNAYLNSFFDLEAEQSYKNSRIGVGKVVIFEKFKKIIDERNS